MFLVAVTNSSIAHQFSSVKVTEVGSDSFTITIIEDGFLSKNYLNPRGFSINESPSIDRNDSQDIILSRFVYTTADNTFEIYKPAISGRPIYYHINSKGEFFCSTHISMLRKAGVVIEENTEALPEFFVYRYVMPPVTLYKNIFHLAPEGRLHVGLVDGKWTIKSIDRYVPPEEDRHADSLANIEGRVRHYLYQAVDALNTRRDRLALLNSGGLDSSILFKICQSRYDIKSTYSTEYPFEDLNKNTERSYALSAAKAFGTNHNLYQGTTEDYLQGFLHGINVAEEPLNHLQSVMMYLLFKEGIPQSSDLVLSAVGADTIFGMSLGTALYKYKKWPHSLLTVYPMPELLRIGFHADGRGERIHRHLTAIASVRIQGDKESIERPEHIIWSEDEYGDKEWVCKYFGVTKSDIIKNRLNAIKPFLDRSIYDVLCILDFLGLSSDTTATWAKMAESQHRALYCPFTQLDIVNYTFSLPWNIKLKKPKNLLRGVARLLEMPDFIINRPKSGFGINRSGWAGKGSFLEPLVPLASKVFDEKEIRVMQSADPKKAMTFWNILNYSIWRRLCIDNEPVEALLEQLVRSSFNLS